MRPILALAILLLGLKSATPEPKYQDSLLVAGENPLSSPFEFEPSIGKAAGELVLAVPSAEWSGDAHEQAEETVEPPQLPLPASTDIDSHEAASQSLDDLCNALLTSAENNDLPVPFFANLIWQESRLRHDAVSPAGALGIAQFMPRVAVEAGVGDPFDPRQAIPASARLLHALREHFGNLGFVAAAYNAGARRVGEWLDHRRALPRETRTYVVRVTGHSVEAWRKTPLDDSNLTFVRPLPCRELPAFAELEQARMREAQPVQEAQQQPQQQQEKVAPRVAQKTAPRAAQKFAQKIAPKVANKLAQKIAKKAVSKVAQKTQKNTPVARRLATAERKQERKAGQSAATGIIARNFHGKHDAARQQHAPHEKRRVAQQASALRRA